jgi:hypothetical protein
MIVFTMYKLVAAWETKNTDHLLLNAFTAQVARHVFPSRF